MDTREKAMKEIEQLVQEIHNEWLSSAAIRDIVDLPSLSDHFDNQPSKLVAEKDCLEDHTETGRNYPCHLCADEGIISRIITQKEAAEILLRLFINCEGILIDESNKQKPIAFIYLPSGEKVRLAK